MKTTWIVILFVLVPCMVWSASVVYEVHSQVSWNGLNVKGEKAATPATLEIYRGGNPPVLMTKAVVKGKVNDYWMPVFKVEYPIDSFYSYYAIVRDAFGRESTKCPVRTVVRSKWWKWWPFW